jgi:hypothetical protein
MVICIVNDCESESYCKEMCNKHYLRKRRGKPIAKKSWQELSPKERLNKFIQIDSETNCWIWIGAKNRKGYGSIHFNGKTRISHRLAYELYIGEITDEKLVCHHCDRPACCNPSHLFLGTNLDNSNDKFSKNRFNPNFGEKNGNSKLSTSEVIEIKKMLTYGKKLVEIAKMFNITPENLSEIKKGKTWRCAHV